MPTNAELANNLTEKISALFSGGNLKEDAQRNVRALVQSAFSKLDMVSREEFDAQVAVLQRSREKIELLEQQLQELQGLLKRE